LWTFYDDCDYFLKAELKSWVMCGRLASRGKRWEEVSTLWKRPSPPFPAHFGFWEGQEEFGGLFKEVEPFGNITSPPPHTLVSGAPSPLPRPHQTRPTPHP
jgi:hypothetical protein